MISVAEEVKKKLQLDMLKSVINADTQLVDKKHSGKFISNITYDVTHLTNLLSTAILNVFKDSLTLIGLLFVMFYQNWKLALISIIMIPLAGIAAKVLGKRMSKVTPQTQGYPLCLISENTSCLDKQFHYCPRARRSRRFFKETGDFSAARLFSS
jgi:subfamily B ATP-binding cassette protein MsbA